MSWGINAVTEEGQKRSRLQPFLPHWWKSAGVDILRYPFSSRLKKKDLITLKKIKICAFYVCFCCWSEGGGATACSCSGGLSTIQWGQLLHAHLRVKGKIIHSYITPGHCRYVCVSVCVCRRGRGEGLGSCCVTGGILTTPTYLLSILCPLSLQSHPPPPPPLLLSSSTSLACLYY